jgi:hypothetical protein
MKNCSSLSYKTAKFMALFLMIFSFASFSAMAQKKEKKVKVIDNQSYTVTLTEEASKKPTKPLADELSFKGDKLKSKVLNEKYKFGAGSFTATIDSTNIDEPIITFEAEMKGETDDDIMNWKGTINGEDIEGTATWNKRGKVKKEFSFSGVLKKKK